MPTPKSPQVLDWLIPVVMCLVLAVVLMYASTALEALIGVPRGGALLAFGTAAVVVIAAGAVRTNRREETAREQEAAFRAREEAEMARVVAMMEMELRRFPDDRGR